MTQERIDYVRYTCDGCYVKADVPAARDRPVGWASYLGRDYHSVECWFTTLSSGHILVQGRGILPFTEAAEPYLK